MRSVSLPTLYHQNRSLVSIFLKRRRSLEGRSRGIGIARPDSSSRCRRSASYRFRGCSCHDLSPWFVAKRVANVACNVNCPRGDPPVGPQFCYRPACASAQYEAYVICKSFNVIAYNLGKDRLAWLSSPCDCPTATPPEQRWPLSTALGTPYRAARHEPCQQGRPGRRWRLRACGAMLRACPSTEGAI